MAGWLRLPRQIRRHRVRRVRLRRLVADLQGAFDAGAEAVRRQPPRRPAPLPPALALRCERSGHLADPPPGQETLLAGIELRFVANLPPDAAAEWEEGEDFVLALPPPRTRVRRFARRLQRWLYTPSMAAGRVVTVRIAADAPAQVTFEDPPSTNQEGTER